jgi:nitrous oxide reductase accessory protein NosL
MELVDASRFVGLDGANPGPLSAKDSATFGAGDYSKKAEIFLEKQGGKVHPIFDTEDKYLQQRSTAPTQNAFK